MPMSDFQRALGRVSQNAQQRLVALRWLRREGEALPQHVGQMRDGDRAIEVFQRRATNGEVQNYELWRDGDGTLQIRTFHVGSGHQPLEAKFSGSVSGEL